MNRSTSFFSAAPLLCFLLLAATPAPIFADGNRMGSATSDPAAVSVADDSILAFVGVTVLPMTNGEVVLRGYTVIVENGQIAAVGPSGAVDVPEGARILDGAGRWLLPGLAEMHAHLPPPGTSREEMEDLLFLYLANGVTTIRTMLGAPNHLEVRDAVNAGDLLGPTIFAAAPSLSGTSVPDPETAERAIRFLAGAGYDLLKLHPGLSREIYDRIVEVAREEGITWAGHVSPAVGLEHSIGTGKSTVDHLDGYLEAAASPEVRARLEGGEVVRLTDVLSSITEERMVEVSRTLAEGGVWTVPTMYLWERFYDDTSADELERLPEMRFASAMLLRQWRAQKENRFFVNLLEDWRSGGALSAADVPSEVAYDLIDFRRKMLRILGQEGAPLLLGTDSPQMFMVPGFAVHHEIRVMAESGVPPLTILESGSRNVAEYVRSHLGGDGSFGSIVPGARADLILVEGNPLEELGHLQDPAGVMVRGTWLPRELIRSRLEAIAERASAP